MKKNILSIVVSVLFCCGLLLTLSACGPDRNKKDTTTPDNPLGVEVDADTVGEGEDGSDIIVVEPKDPDIDIAIIPKDPSVDVEIAPKDDTFTSDGDIDFDIDFSTGADYDVDIEPAGDAEAGD